MDIYVSVCIIYMCVDPVYGPATDVGVCLCDPAIEDAEMYLATPGLGLSYGVGKAQIIKFLSLCQQVNDRTRSRQSKVHFFILAC
eukprot:SAG31_NODE_2844_length_5009_cov_2.067006_4_plen_85_part_00